MGNSLSWNPCVTGIKFVHEMFSLIFFSGSLLRTEEFLWPQISNHSEIYKFNFSAMQWCQKVPLYETYKINSDEKSSSLPSLYDLLCLKVLFNSAVRIKPK